MKDGGCGGPWIGAKAHRQWDGSPMERLGLQPEPAQPQHADDAATRRLEVMQVGQRNRSVHAPVLDRTAHTGQPHRGHRQRQP